MASPTPTPAPAPPENSAAAKDSVAEQGSEHARLRQGLGWGVALGVFLIYLATAAPGAWWGDGQELACAAWTLGIPHPTGYPLYTLTVHMWMKLLGFIDPGRAATLYNAVLLAGSCGLLLPLLRRILSNDPAKTHDAPGCACGMADLLPAAGVVLLVAFARTVWEHATFTEVYPLTFFFGVVILRLAWPDHEHPSAGRAALLGLTLGLASLNHYSIVALYPLVGLSVLAWARRSPRPARVLVLAGLCFGVMLLGYLYLPWRARMNPALNWGDPANWARLKWVLSGGQFKELKVEAGTGAMAAGGLRWLAWWGTLWLPARLGGVIPALLLGTLTLGLAVLGLVRLMRARIVTGAGLMLALAATGGFALLYHIPDIDAYFMIALPAAAVGWIVGTQGLLQQARRRIPGFGRGSLYRALPALLGLAALAGNYGAIDKSWDDGPQAWGKAVMAALPKDALVITGGDSDIYSLWYQQMVHGERPDVTVFGSQFIFSGWYGKYFEAPGRPKVPIHTEDRPPRDKLTYDLALWSGVILPNMAQQRPVFITYTSELLFAEYLSPKPVAALLPAAYYQVCAYPYGLPSPVLYQLQPNPRLTGLSKEQLAGEFQRYYMRQQGGR